MVTTRTKHAFQYVNLVPAWRELCQIPANQQTCQQWKLHCTSTFNKQWDIQKLNKVGYFDIQANSATETGMGEQLVDSLYNLANAAVQKKDTVEKESH